MSKTIVFTVINDLTTDQRMQRICTSLVEAGYQVTLVGRKLSNSKPLNKFSFQQIRLKPFFEKGKLFYIEYNIRLFFWLLLKKFDIYSATDLDTILPQFLVAKLKSQPFVYDAHEYFPELPEIVNRPFTRWVWNKIEAFVLPRTKYAYTINNSYASIFKAKYNLNFEIIRNAAKFRDNNLKGSNSNFPQPFILYQGAVNVGRGIEEMIKAMPNINCNLVIAGAGDVLENCKNLVASLKLNEKVIFLGRLNPDDLRQITPNAFLGFTFFTENGISYKLSLANRFFDYFHAGVPQLVVNFPEYRNIISEYEVGLLLNDLTETSISDAVNRLLNDPKLYDYMKSNCLEARQNINWQNEAKKLVVFYQNLVNEEF